MARSLPRSSRKKIVSIGGGNGTYLVGDGLRDKHVDVTILSTPADNGGDSGTIRDELGEFLPPGDMRRGIMALIDSRYSAQMREWFEERLEDVQDPNSKKRNVGNFIISSAIKTFGTIEGLKFVEWLCRVNGTVLPMSTDDVHLHGKLDDGEVIHGETNMDLRPHDDVRILRDVWLEPNAYICNDAAQAILEADLITLGPGDLFTSIAPNLKVKGVSDLLLETKAVIVAIPSLMTKWSETRGYHLHDFVEKMVEFGLGRRQFDFTLINTVEIPPALLTKYETEEKSTAMLLRSKTDIRKLNAVSRQRHSVDLLSKTALRRGLIRHDTRKVAHAIMDIIYVPPPITVGTEGGLREGHDHPLESQELLRRMDDAEIGGPQK